MSAGGRSRADVTVDGGPGPPPLVVEPMRGRHLAAVEAIDRLVFARPWSTAVWRRELADPSRVHLVGLAGGVVGHAGLLTVLDEGHVTTVAVHPDHQGRGVASRLLLGLFDEARARGVDHLTLEVRASDRRAQRLYGRFGFAPAGVRAAYYSDPTDDAVVMWCHDIERTEIDERLDLVRRSLDGAGTGPVSGGPGSGLRGEGER